MADVLGMAFTRDGFKNRLQEYLTGAFNEFLAAKTGEAIGMTKYVDHWNSEVDRFLDIEMVVFFETAFVKSLSKPQQRKKAYEEIKKHMLRHHSTFLRAGLSHVKRVCKDSKLDTNIPKAKYKPDEWCAEFWDRADKAISPDSDDQVKTFWGVRRGSLV